MAGAGAMLVANAMILTILPLTGLVQGFGVNWGNIASHPLNPNFVVGMLKDNNINKVKLFDADPWTMETLAGTGIEVMVGIPNNMLEDLAKDYGYAEDWVKENVTKYMRDGGVNIKYVAVGNEPFLSAYNGSFLKTTFPAFKNIHKALRKAGHGDKMQATIPQNAEVYHSDSDKPSDGDFRSDVKELMLDIVNFFKDNGNPFTVNIYPFLSLYQNQHFPVEFAFFNGNGQAITDKGRTYDSVFDANYDTLVWALKKAGISNMKIIIGEVGWPTDGHIYASPSLAEKFYSGLMKKLANDEGTPLRPGKLDVYLFGLLDEDMKSILPGPFERHWGIFRYDGQPKFVLDFTGQGRKIMPVGAKGVEYMEKQWCVVNKETINLDNVGPDLDYACYHGDCTALLYGSTCNKLDSIGNISYAFNMYFQMQSQDVRACDFRGAASIVKTNASVGTCLFPVQIVSGSGKLLSFVYARFAVLGLVFLGLLAFA
ncbi:PREDICTED: glucan endo-1,3-beta-glucosidase 8 [Tarenaya hassleriana]|uniref:glucan endo-1,3-beta-glucosidase 8 n=1 Tax=Tarenaya hassleriana TaxID=28532 RepID=UPI00053C8003|nr:PREDICTED: glucan endo-1,3-beta-glucosidase 8 [Tarenaya hassleriana]